MSGLSRISGTIDGFSLLPLDLAAKCIEFALDDIDTLSLVSRFFLISSNKACQYVLQTCKNDPLLEPIIKPLLPAQTKNSGMTAHIKSFHEVRGNIRAKARTVKVKTSNPPEVRLRKVIREVEARNFNLFFNTLLDKIPEEQRPKIRRKRKSMDSVVDKAAQGRKWMQENGKLLRNITCLSLALLGLSSLPPEIGLLTGLKELYCNDNEITSLPSQIGLLEGLEKLYLNNNKLSSLPPETGLLKRLGKLYLAGNHFTFVSLEICQLIQLKELVLSENQLSCVSPELCRCLIHLQHLNLNDNQLTDLPQEFSLLVNLKLLSVARNLFASYSLVISPLKNLKMCRILV